MQTLLTRFLPAGRMVYYELDGGVWQLRSQVAAGVAGDAEVQTILPLTTPFLQVPHDTGRAHYPARDAASHETGPHAAAMLPVRTGSALPGVFGFIAAGPLSLSALHRRVLEAAVGSLELALHRERRDALALADADSALLASQSRLHFALEAAGLGAWELDTRTQAATRTLRHDEIFGYPQGHPAWTYQTFLAHVLPEDRPEVERKYSAALARGGAWDFQCRVRRADGEVRWIWARGQALNTAAQGSHLLGLIQDVTGPRLAEANIAELNTHLEIQVRERTRALKDANEELEAFAYSVSHDLRTPLRHIAGFTALLRKHLGGALDVKGARYLGVVEEAVQRMDRLLEAMLDLSRTAQMPVRSAPVDLVRLVQEARAELMSEAAGRQIEWQIGPLPQVTGDATMLRQVLVNLLSNALKYTGKQPSAVIEVWAEPRPDAWAVLVRDNGVGFDPRYASRLFGVFQRLHRQDDYEGTGVGLANVRRIILRHGGEVSAASPPGEGATFSFTLPKPG